MFKKLFGNLLFRILWGLVLGAIVGIFLQEKATWFKPFGDVFIRLLKMIVVPTVIASLILGGASVDTKSLGRIGSKILLFYALTSVLAIVFGLFMANIFVPGQGLEISGSSQSIQIASNDAPRMIDILLNIIPTNPFESFTQGNMLQIIFFTLLFGIGVSTIKSSENEHVRKIGENVFNFFDGVANIMFLMVKWIMEYAPIGVFALIAVVFGQQGTKVLGSLLHTVIIAYTGYIGFTIIIFSLILLLFQLSPFKFFKGTKNSFLTAFVTRSSTGTLPITMQDCSNLGVPKGIYAFSLPLGATINMNGTSIYQGICVFFISSAIGMPLTFSQQLTVIITAVLAAVGTAGVPGSGAIMLLLVLESIGLKVEAGTAVAAAYSLILGIDALLDMGRTALNVEGDSLAAVCIAKSEKMLDFNKYNS